MPDNRQAFLAARINRESILIGMCVKHCQKLI